PLRLPEARLGRGEVAGAVGGAARGGRLVRRLVQAAAGLQQQQADHQADKDALHDLLPFSAVPAANGERRRGPSQVKYPVPGIVAGASRPSCNTASSNSSSTAGKRKSWKRWTNVGDRPEDCSSRTAFPATSAPYQRSSSTNPVRTP